MKKTIVITILIFVLLACASCDNYRQYPSDNATRYPTLAEALDIEEDQIQYSFEDGNIVYVYYTTEGGGHSLFMYKDSEGYVKSSSFREHLWNKHIKCNEIREKCILMRVHYANKYVVILDGFTTNLYTKPTIADNINSEFAYKDYIETGISKVRSFTYFLVLDEIPENYEIYIDGVTYTVDQLTNGDLVMIIVFSTFFGILILIITLVTIKKIKKKKHKAKMDNIWGVR